VQTLEWIRYHCKLQPDDLWGLTWKLYWYEIFIRFVPNDWSPTAGVVNVSAKVNGVTNVSVIFRNLFVSLHAWFLRTSKSSRSVACVFLLAPGFLTAIMKHTWWGWIWFGVLFLSRIVLTCSALPQNIFRCIAVCLCFQQGCEAVAKMKLPQLRSFYFSSIWLRLKPRS